MELTNKTVTRQYVFLLFLAANTTIIPTLLVQHVSKLTLYIDLQSSHSHVNQLFSQPFTLVTDSKIA